jgi:hypothetical protein
MSQHRTRFYSSPLRQFVAPTGATNCGLIVQGAVIRPRASLRRERMRFTPGDAFHVLNADQRDILLNEIRAPSRWRPKRPTKLRSFL